MMLLGIFNKMCSRGWALAFISLQRDSFGFSVSTRLRQIFNKPGSAMLEKNPAPAKGVRPVSNVVLLPCQAGSTVARLGFRRRILFS